MRDAGLRAPRESIPTYGLYGESSASLPPERLHCESIASRSRLHDWHIRPHRHEAFFQILYMRGGRGTLVLENERLPLRAPCVVTLPSLTVHGFTFSRDVQGVVVTLVERHLDEMLSAPDLREVFSRPHRILLGAKSRTAAVLRGAFETVSGEYDGNLPWRLPAVRAGLELALVTVARAIGESAHPVSGTAARKMQHLQRFRALVDRWYREHRSIEEYSRALGITSTQLNRICREVLGKSALGVVNGRLLREAERNLIYTTLDIKRIALALGFADAAYFSRFFAKHTGRAPSRFRQEAWRALGQESRPEASRSPPAVKETGRH